MHEMNSILPLIRSLCLLLCIGFEATDSSCVDKPKEATFSQFSECPNNSRNLQVYKTKQSARSMLECSKHCANDGQCFGFSFSKDNSTDFCDLSDLAAESCSDLKSSKASRYYFKKTGISDCTASWQKVYETIGTSTIHGTMADLADYIKKGAKVRVKFPSCSDENFSILTSDTVWVTPNNSVIAQAFTFWYGSWSMILLDAKGSVDIQMHGSARKSCWYDKKVAMSWFVKKAKSLCSVKTGTRFNNAGDNKETVQNKFYANPLLMNDKVNGLAHVVSLDLAESAMKEGFTFQMVCEMGDMGARSIPLEDFSFSINGNGNSFTARTPWVGNNPLVVENFTLDFTFFKRIDLNLFASMYLDTDITLGYENGFNVALNANFKWYGHYCWEKIYATGAAAFGSVEDLVEHVKNFGSRVRVSYTCVSPADGTTYVHSNLRVTISNDSVVVALSELSVIEGPPKESLVNFYWEQKEIFSNGSVKVYLHDHKQTRQWLDHSCLGETTWFVDTMRRREAWLHDASSRYSSQQNTLDTALTTPTTLGGRLPTVGLAGTTSLIIELYTIQLLLFENSVTTGGAYQAVSFRDMGNAQFRLVTISSAHEYGVEMINPVSGKSTRPIPIQTKVALIKWFV